MSTWKPWKEAVPSHWASGFLCRLWHLHWPEIFAQKISILWQPFQQIMEFPAHETGAHARYTPQKKAQVIEINPLVVFFIYFMPETTCASSTMLGRRPMLITSILVGLWPAITARYRTSILNRPWIPLRLSAFSAGGFALRIRLIIS